MRKKISKAQADAALASIKDQWKSYINSGYKDPVLVRDHDWVSPNEDGEYPWGIHWEEGPHSWAYAGGPRGGVDFESSEGLGRMVEVPPALNWPEGVWAEATNTWSLSLYPKD